MSAMCGYVTTARTLLLLLLLWFGYAEGRACPADVPGQYWAQLSDGNCTTVTALVAAFGFQEASGNRQCTSGSCRCGPRAAPAVLRDAADATAVAALVPAGSYAWLGLQVVTNSSTGRPVWAWNNDRPASSYGLTNGSAWGYGEVPDASTGAWCAILGSDGLLQYTDCSVPAAIPAACTIPACPCPIPGNCTTAVRSPEGQGFGCASSTSTLQVTSFHVFARASLPYYESDIPPSDSLAAGCGQALNRTLDTLTGLPTLPVLPGDVVRVCGVFPAGLQQTAVSYPAATTIAGYVPRSFVRGCEGSLGLAPTACLEIVVATEVAWGAAAYSFPGVSAGDDDSCSITVAVAGAIQCWSIDPEAVAASAPVDLPPVVSVASADAHTCVVLAATGTVRCWGDNRYRQADVPSDLPAAVGVAASPFHTCALLFDGGSVRCWGDAQGAQIVPAGVQGAVAIVACTYGSCALLGGAQAGAVVCWGRWATGFPNSIYNPTISVPSTLPAVHQVAAGHGHTCVLAVGTGAVRCFGAESSVSSAFPPDGTLAAAVSAGLDFTCVILAGSGRVQCWGDNSYGQLDGIPAVPMVSLSSSLFHTCGCEADTGRVWCWGRDARGQASSPVDAMGLPAAALSLRSLPILLKDSQSAEAFQLDMTQAVQFRRLFAYTDIVSLVSSLVIELERAQPNGTVPVPPAFLFGTQSDLKYPVLYVYTQAAPDAVPVRRVCVLYRATAYSLQCPPTSFMYGAEAFVFDGQAFQRVAAYRWPGSVQLQRATASPSVRTLGLPPSSVDAAAVAVALGNATSAEGGPPFVLVVRPGDAVTLLGAGFGLHAARLQAVPWWNSTARAGSLRSCIHLAWWASPASYHNDSACVCNGLEDWLGEGELPLSAITAWSDTLITFTAPLAEGIREVRLCVEGLGLDSAVSPPRSSASIYLAWDPPVLEDLLPAAYVESTDADTDVSLQLAMASDLGISVPVWGTCDAMFASAADARAWYSTPLPTTVSFALLRHCSATPYVQVSLGHCSVGAGYQAVESMLPLGSRPAANCTPGLRWMQPRPEGVVTVSASTSFQVPLLQPMPNAVLNATVRVSIWDGGILLSAAQPSSSLEFTRSPPLIKSCSPNPLLLGPVGGISTQEGAQATLTLYGVGFRTPAEVLDPRNGLTGLHSSAEVLVAGEPCLNVSVTRSSKLFAVVTCTYPSRAVGGGTLPVTLRMIGVETTLSVDDGSTVALSTQCAAGYYGQFDVAGHQVCRPCPAGGECRGGVGRAPVAQPGFYNMGLPSREKLNESDAQVRYTSVSALQGAMCPPGSSDGGRDLACVLPCEPQDACLGGNVCAEGYVSVPPVFRCARCAPRYYRSSGVCVPCPVIGLGAILLLSAALVAACGAMLVLSSNAIRLCTLNTVLEYVQIMSLMQGPTLPWPPTVQGALRVFSAFRVNIEVAAPECYSSISLTPEAKLWVVVMLPLVVLALAAGAFLALGLGKRLFLRRRIASGSASASGTTAWVFFAGDTWSHGPACCRTALKLLGVLYLPVISSSLAVWDCTPTQPSDGKEYLSIVFEECGLPGGLQERMMPWAIAGLVAYGALYPALLALFFHRYHDLIVEDQLLRAAGTGDDKRSNPRALALRQYAAPLYEDYRPGYQYAALLTLARKALVCVCSLMLNKSSVLQCGGIAFVVVVVYHLQRNTAPLMTPGLGYVSALAEFSSKAHMGADPKVRVLQEHLSEIAERTRHPQLLELAAGQAMCTDVAAAEGAWWVPGVDWNGLESQLQLQVVLTGLLAVMYAVGLESVYSARAVPAVTGVFILLLALAVTHISITVGYDLFLQVHGLVQSLLDSDGATAAGSQSAGISPLPVPLWRAGLVVCCPCALSRARARQLLTGVDGSGASTVTATRAEHARVTVADWLSNPLDARGAKAAPTSARALPVQPGLSQPQRACMGSLQQPLASSARGGQQSRQGHAQGSVAPAFAVRRDAAPAPAPTSPAGDATTVLTLNPLHHLKASVGAGAAVSPVSGISGSSSPGGGQRSSVRLSSMQLASGFVQVDVEHVITMVEPPVPENWCLIRSSFIALWELVEFEQRGGERLRQEVQDLRRESAVTQEEMAALRLLVQQLQAASPSAGPPGPHEAGSSTALRHGGQSVQGLALSLAMMPPAESSGQYG